MTFGALIVVKSEKLQTSLMYLSLCLLCCAVFRAYTLSVFVCCDVLCTFVFTVLTTVLTVLSAFVFTVLCCISSVLAQCCCVCKLC